MSLARVVPSLLRSARFALGAAVLVSAVQGIGAQPTAAPTGVSIAPARDTVRLETGQLGVLVFRLRNTDSTIQRLQPRLVLPAGWQDLDPASSISLAAGAADTWMGTVVVPAQVRAGAYLVEARVAELSARLTVIIAERHGIEVSVASAPRWMVTGGPLTATFLVRNRGNVPAVVNLHARDLSGRTLEVDPDLTELPPGASLTVPVQQAAMLTSDQAGDAFIELAVAERDYPAVKASAVAHTMVVPDGTAGAAGVRLPFQLALRAMQAGTGVAPATLMGGGMLPDATTRVQLFAVAPSNNGARFGFGERGDFRMVVERPNARLRAGEELFGFSPLTTSGLLATGADLRWNGRAGSLAAAVNRPRWISHAADELALNGVAQLGAGLQLSAIGVSRQRAGAVVTRIGSLGIDWQASDLLHAAFEAARSDSAQQGAMALRGRAEGNRHGVSYSVGRSRAAAEFAGPAHGSVVSDAAISWQASDALLLAVSGNGRQWSPWSAALPALEGFSQHSRSLSASATWRGAFTAEMRAVERRDLMHGERTVDGSQRGGRLTAALPLGALRIVTGVEAGVSDDFIRARRNSFSLVSVDLRLSLGARGNFSVYGSQGVGRTIVGGAAGTLSSGARVQLALPFGLDLSSTVSAQRASLGELDGSGAWFSNADLRLDHRFASGATLGLRARTWQLPARLGPPASKALFVEYSRPFGVRLRSSARTGRAVGRVVDGATGAPMAGLLVQVGGAAAVTDARGRVEFRGLRPGAYRVGVDVPEGQSGRVATGDLSVQLHENAEAPAEFTVEMMRGARVRAVARRFEAAAGTVGTHADSMIASGTLPNLVVALEGPRDTLVRVSDAFGTVDFGEVAPGQWSLVVRAGELPAAYRFANDRQTVAVAAGAPQAVELRLVPERKSITFVGGDDEVKVLKESPAAAQRRQELKRLQQDQKDEQKDQQKDQQKQKQQQQ